MKIHHCIKFAGLIIFTSCSLINAKLSLPDDNPVEQALEFVIEKETGLKIDLTPAN